MLAATPVCGVTAAHATEFVVRATTVPEMKAVFGQVESRIVVRSVKHTTAAPLGLVSTYVSAQN